MNPKFKSMRIRRNYLTVLTFLCLFTASVYALLSTIQARGAIAYVFLLAISTLAFFFLTLLCFFVPYMRVDDDRIIVAHDLLRKDILFFYDLNRIEFEADSSVALYHMNGLTRVVFRKFNTADRTQVITFFKELEQERH